MRKLLIVALLLNAGFLFAIWQQLSVVAEVGGGAGASPCDTDQTKYSLDTNDDGGIDLSDFVFGLSWFFQGTEAPRVCLATDALEARIAALENQPGSQLTQDQVDILSNMSTVQIPTDDVGGTAKTIRITGCNLQIVNGLGQTNGGGDPASSIVTATNAVGNLIVGYQELGNPAGDDRTGSHNIVVGTRHNYSSVGGLVIGYQNTISGSYSSVSGGFDNISSQTASSVSGGANNMATANFSSVSGGFLNTASGDNSSVSGGTSNEASAVNSSVSGGRHNTASGDYSSVSGGGGPDAILGNEASFNYSSVSGGGDNTASGDRSSVSGGTGNTASHTGATVSGGSGNSSAGPNDHDP